MSWRIITPPASLPVSVAEFRAHLWNIYDGHDSDAELEVFIRAATAAGETFCGRRFLERVVQIDAPGTGLWLLLPFGDFRGMTGWEYDDAEGSAQSGELSALKVRRQGGLCSFAEVWIPPVAGADSARLNWRCGMADSPESLPEDIRISIMQTAAYWYNNRAAAAQTGEVGDVKFLPEMGRVLLHPYRLNFIPDALMPRSCRGAGSGGDSGGGGDVGEPVVLWSNAANITVMAPETVTTKSKVWTWAPQTREHPECFDVPGNLTLTALEVLNEITNKWEDVSAEFDVSETEHDGEPYRRYTDNRGYRAGERQIRIIWR